MRTEFIYSVAALAAVPVVANADVDAFKASAVQTVTTSADAELTVGTLAKGKYTLKINAITIANAAAGDKLTVKLMAGATELGSWQVASGSGLNETFTLDSNIDGVKIVLVKGTKQVTVPAPVITLNFDFAGVADKLQIEYLKVTTAMGVLEDYPEKTTDATTYSALYNRISAIKSANYDSYKNDLEGLQALYDAQTGDNYQSLGIYAELLNAMSTVNGHIYAVLCTSNTADMGVNVTNRYNALANIYKTNALNDAKQAYEEAKDAYNNEGTRTAVYKLQPLKDALEAFLTQVKAQEEVKATNEAAKTQMDNALKAVYNSADPTDANSYYGGTALEAFKLYADATGTARYAELKADAESALAALVGTGSNNAKYQAVVNAINEAYNNLTINKESVQTSINSLIAAFKEQITQVVTEYNGYFDTLKSAYATYDGEKAAADELTAGAADFLVSYKTGVDNAVAGLLTLIENNDTKANIGNLTDDAIQGKVTAIETAKATYTTQKGIYDDWQAMLTELDTYAATLGTNETAIKNYAKTTKQVPESDYNVANIWASVNTTIQGLISTATTNVNNNKTNATTYKASDAYTDAKAEIEEALESYVANANAATDLFARIYTAHKNAKTTYDDIYDIEGIQEYKVWNNQVTIDDAAKARTPYLSVLNGINTEIGNWAGKMAEAKTKTASQHLSWLEENTPESVLTDEQATLDAIKANYTTDEQLFETQLVYMDMDALKLQINSKATQLETSIAPYETKITNGEYGNVGKIAVQEEITELKAVINAAKAEAAKENAETTKDKLSAHWTAINGLTLTDLETASQTAIANYATFTANKNTLVGQTTDDQYTSNTLSALNKYYTTQKNHVQNDLNDLTATQKTAKKTAIDNAEVTVTEGGQQVKYTLASLTTAINTATENEVLTDAEVTRYQGVISNLKSAANAVAVQAEKLNEMERQLALVDFTTAKADVLAADANEQGYYYTLLTGTTTAGQYQYDFNALKNEIEALTNITNDIMNGYTPRINAIKALVNAVAGKAAQCKTAYDGANSYLNETETLLQNGITEYSKDKWKSSVQAQNLTVLQGYAASDGKIAGLRQAILDQYNNGALESTASVNGVNNTALRIEIQILLDQYMNESTYNAQVQADNDAIYQRVQDAKNEAKLAQQSAADYINAYRNLKSTELKGVLEDPVVKAANDAVVELLYSFEATTNAITQQAAQEYAATASPAHYDEKGEASIAAYGEVVDNIQTAVAAFTAAISNTYSAVIQNSIDTYAAAITDAKAKVKTYTTDEGATKSNAQMNALFGGIDGMQSAITDNFISEPENIEQLTENLKALDDALYDAEDADNGILAKIKNVKESNAHEALEPFFVDWSFEDRWGYIANCGAASNRDFFNDNLTEADDLNDYWDYHYKVMYQAVSTWIDDFATMKARLYEIKAAAEKNYANNAAKLATIAAINTTATKLAGAYTTCYSYVAGAQVKADLDAIQQNLSQYPTDKVTPANAEEWAEKVAAIDASIDEWNGTLYTAVVASIPTLLQEAKDAYITFVANNPGTDQKAIIDNAETSFGDVKAAVNDGTKTIDEALTDLSVIEGNLVAVTTQMRIANNNGETPNADVTLYNELMQKYNELDDANTLDGFRSEVVGEYAADKAAIDAQLVVLNTYLNANQANIKVYHANALAMINDIEADIQTMIGAAQALQQQLDEEDAEYAANQALWTLENTWRQAQNAINTANNRIAFMESQLAQYGSTSKYANKIAQLKSQMAEVQGIYDEAYADAEALETTAEKQPVATGAKNAINTAISNYDVETNCDQIIDLAKKAYVTEKVEAMAAEIAAITWNAANYTTSDQTKLNNAKDDIIANVGGEKSNADVVATTAANYYTGAYNRYRAEDVVYNSGYINRGVISTLANYKANFDEAVAELKQMLKDMSLEEEVKGHITGEDNITVNDVAALTNLIANQQEGSLDLDRGDVNGDGRITVTDVIWLQYFTAFGEWPDGTTNARAYGDVAEGINSVSLETIAMGDVTRIAVKLDNETAFRAFQIGLQLPAGAEVVAESLGERVANGYLMRTEAGEGMVRFMTISDIATPFAGNEGAVLYIDVKGMTGSAQLTEAYFSDTMYNEADLTATGNQTTGIAERITNAIDGAAQKVYNLGGRLMEGVKKGINIIRNADGTTTKVVKK